jgi:hypothetical protein
MNKWVSLAVDALFDFVIAAGGAFMAIGGTTMPTKYQILICVMSGLVLACGGAKKTLSMPPA